MTQDRAIARQCLNQSSVGKLQLLSKGSPKTPSVNCRTVIATPCFSVTHKKRLDAIPLYGYIKYVILNEGSLDTWIFFNLLFHRAFRTM